MPALNESAKKGNKVTANTKSIPAKTRTSPILAAVHEAAKDLYSGGAIDKVTMREFDALCLPEVPNYTPAESQDIRCRCRASQQVFAKYINITASSLQKWETGAKKPNSSALKLLNLVDKKGLEVLA